VLHQTLAEAHDADRASRKVAEGTKALTVVLALECLALIGAQVRTEMEDLIEDFARLEVSATTIEVNIPSRRESSLIIIDDPNAPASALDGLMAAAAPGLAGRRPLGTVDARSALVRRTFARGTLQSVSIGYVLESVAEPLKELLRPLVGRARRMEPHYHLAFRKQVGKALAETQLSALDEPVATATLRATARSPYEDVSHAAGRVIHDDSSGPPRGCCAAC